MINIISEHIFLKLAKRWNRVLEARKHSGKVTCTGVLRRINTNHDVWI